MVQERTGGDPEMFIHEIDTASQQIADCSAYFRRLKGKLARARKSLVTKPDTVSQAAKLIADLRGMQPEPEFPATLNLLHKLDQHLTDIQRRRKDSFPSDLHQACQKARLDFSALSDGFGIGPFLLTIDLDKEVASLRYAKVEVEGKISLGVSDIVAQVQASMSRLFDRQVDTNAFKNELGQAMRVAAARQEATPKTPLRVDLPAIFREMRIIKEVLQKSRRSQSDDYSLPQFVVDLKRFAQSNENVTATQQFHLETAVLENTKNPKKSIFIPRDLDKGFGEGTYYQAIVLR